MQKKKLLVMSSLLMAIVLLSIGTIAYFRRTVAGTAVGPAGNLVLIVNEANSVSNETFSVSLNRSEDEQYVYPDDSGTFDINIDTTGSSRDVAIAIKIERNNLPDNLKFYLDEEYTKILSTSAWKIEKSDDMTLTVPVYWFWDGSVDDENDSAYIDVELSAVVKVTATIADSLYNFLLNSDYNLDTSVNFSSTSTSSNGEGLMMMEETVYDEYPIIYYRGNITNNNVIFNDFCWLIVRTTETGGVKLLYNGEVNEDGSCNNYSGVGGATANTDAKGAWADRKNQLFNDCTASPVCVGYMYNDSDKYYTYTTNWKNGTLDATGYVTHLADDTIDSETGHHIQNLKDSTIKGTIDEWYEAYFLGTDKEKMLEDTVWCNDRSVTHETYSIENYATNSYFYYSSTTRRWYIDSAKPQLTCSRNIDSFTVDNNNGNGDLNYPIGLLTMDELIMAGNTQSNVATTLYLSIANKPYDFSTMTPYSFSKGYAYVACSYKGMTYIEATYYAPLGVRPSISLNNAASLIIGDGSYENPYLVG